MKKILATFSRIAASVDVRLPPGAFPVSAVTMQALVRTGVSPGIRLVQITPCPLR